MEDARQKAFQKLRPACVDLSSVALKFRGKQTTVKNVLQALDKFYGVLKDQAVFQNLNDKLAEYAFFPLTHIFNESQRLSSRCLELAVLSLQALASQGWREKLSPELGKQLLILLTLLASGSPGNTQTEPPSDDLKVASFDCIGIVVTLLGASSHSNSIFDDLGTRNIVDQLVFLLLEAISEDPSDRVQLSASQALQQVNTQIVNRLVLASLLPRTVSTLTKVLRPSTQKRRTYKVFEANLNLFRTTLQRVLNDRIALVSTESDPSQQVPTKTEGDEPRLLGESWLKATSAQIKIALINVTKLRRHDRAEVKRALAQLCLMVLEECSQSLAECASVTLETLLFLINEEDMGDVSSGLKYLLSSRPSLADNLKASLQKWMSALPRLMQGVDERPRQSVLAQISKTFQLLSSLGHTSGLVQQSMPLTLIASILAATQPGDQKMISSISEPASSISQILTTGKDHAQSNFQTIVLDQRAQQGSLTEFLSLLGNLGALEQGTSITRAIIDTIPTADGCQRISAIWLALRLLGNISSDVIDEFVVFDSSMGLSLSKPFLISDLYSYTLPIITRDEEYDSNTNMDWQAQALALECLVLQAGQLGTSYRSELMDSLYPMLSFLSSRNGLLQKHAMTALNMLTKACQYPSVTDMLVDNVDYLVNSIALKLNSSNLAPQAPQVLLMMVRLCGARLIPYLDDLIGTIFVALDDFHGYPELVELLFEVLSAIVDEGAKQPALVITEGKETPEHRKTAQLPSGVNDILGDFVARRIRKSKLDEPDEQITSAPQRPWSDNLDGLQHNRNASDQIALAENEEEDEKMPLTSTSEEEEKPLSNTHQLLLSIGRATTPHLSSPSLKVRHTLLSLLNRITPLLAKNENSFLPLINSIWPALTARLFGQVFADGDGEVAFNVSAAAETMASLCEGAGDFMASRIEDILPQLQSLWRSTYKKVEAKRARTIPRPSSTQAGSSLATSVDIQLTLAPPKDLENTRASSSQSLVLNRTTDAQLLYALITLLSSILNFVHVSDDNGDAIFSMLAPIMNEPGNETIRTLLENWNYDAVWLVRERSKIEHEMTQGFRELSDWAWRPTCKLPKSDLISCSNFQEVVF